ncbi:TonB-dependent receptor domain-containing protein [Tenacibaculum finnmarkense]|uniref:TonB-dependent receptor n=1 Tax=Tenacibaculum finnmarkense genomovar ulcerans TaxID=2781388 RepID=A0A2I2MBY9_9FLAO|nr:TonB-dependent receptor [Tenacibaculum finnmarkense]MBE7633900.1 TonB-dependent receptor [Tenacibaculum finnmarkense genomovar ulcerans]MBE7645736.1 TonB-dependent receptor [Tenacibaculum finnmarkense genomovar ulcerans]MBE7647795.1 TonB-dependent receptor [Tenacibaculum finnmarkense genomovar ulcerans]MBE7688080.1 TonB-dependent receptor [Tenacibaculum finnmarkense genomovar ulcerans]MBE7697678.1 TonB-dependent receptor [Tenacibaculum finnmarkense genomovar ulcerans]
MKITRKIAVTLSCLLSTCLYSQFKISGKITNQKSNSAIKNVTVYINKAGDLWQNSKGNYVISDLKPGDYELAFYSEDYHILNKKVTIENENIVLNASLKKLEEYLSEVVITAHKKKVFSLQKLQDVQEVAIYAGKKSEVVLLGNTIANLATNNARQIYSKVAGLNIWESDGGGLQLGIGGRGLDPNRTSNFNVRQNGYDISADALGYPENYYTPPTEALEKIEIVRGAASLQYGTQFGGLLNFKLKKPNKNKEFSLSSRQTLASFGLFNSFNTISGTVGKVGYIGYLNYKRGDGYRPNSDFNQYNAFAGVYSQLNKKSKLGVELTYMEYLAHQSGGLSETMFDKNPKQSNRARNWFEVRWLLSALHFDHKFSNQTKLNLRAFTLNASRKAVGFRHYEPEAADPVLSDAPAERELIVGNFKTFGAEARLLHHYDLFNSEATFLAGARYYQGNNTGKQGLGTDKTDADFKFISLDNYIKKSFYDEITINSSSYKYPNKNAAVFIENIIKVSDELSFTPGVRFENINTKAIGSYRNIKSNIAGDIRSDVTKEEHRSLSRNFFLLGLGTSYKPTDKLELYANFSQNYRSITFSDIRVVSPNSLVDPNIEDEKGFSVDLGLRGKLVNVLKFDVTGFYLNYDNRLGDILGADPNSGILKRIRTNVGSADILGVESLVQWKVLPTFNVESNDHDLSAFVNLAVIKSKYTKQYYPTSVKSIEGNQVEFVPAVNLKTGLQYRYKKLGTSLQYSYLSKQFTDASNALAQGGNGTVGEIPSFQIMDLSFSYDYSKRWSFEAGVNNMLNNSYFTRRATGYPGPGIIPSDPRSFYGTIEFKL